jgi:hypothetical protein
LNVAHSASSFLQPSCAISATRGTPARRVFWRSINPLQRTPQPNHRTKTLFHHRARSIANDVQRLAK